MKQSRILVLLLVLVFFTSAADASYSYEFVLPAWDSNDNPALFGTHPVVRVSVDNGIPHNHNQVYTNSEITEIVVNAINGTYSNAWTGSDIYLFGTTDLTASFISTDGAGIPTLDLFTEIDERVVFSNDNGTWQFGALPGYALTWLEDAPAFSSPNQAFHYQPFLLQGTVVPVPAAVWLFGSGLLGLVGMARSKKVV